MFLYFLVFFFFLFFFYTFAQKSGEFTMPKTQRRSILSFVAGCLMLKNQRILVACRADLEQSHSLYNANNMIKYWEKLLKSSGTFLPKRTYTMLKEDAGHTYNGSNWASNIKSIIK